MIEHNITSKRKPSVKLPLWPGDETYEISRRIRLSV